MDEKEARHVRIFLEHGGKSTITTTSKLDTSLCK